MGAMTFFSLEDVTFRHAGSAVLAGTTWHVRAGEHWALIGPNGSGKSLLLRGIAGRLVVSAGQLRHQFLDGDPHSRDSVYGVHPRGSIELVSPDLARRLTIRERSFHQVRWHATAAHGRLVAELLSYESIEGLSAFRVDRDTGERAAHEACRASAIARLGLESLLDRRWLELSSGEQRKLLFARALCRAPKLLLIDDPFTGLDAGYRSQLREVLAQLVAEGVKVVLATRRAEEVPSWVTHVLRLESARVVDAGPRAAVLARAPVPAENAPHRGRTVLAAPTSQAGEPLVELRAVRVQYGAKVILDGVDWVVRAGEHWALVGPNGAGKSALLSLVIGDNPLAYANDVRLFGRRRGTGESIWDLRRRIGWMGPELDAHFPSRTRCFDAVCSGFAGTFGPAGARSDDERERAQELLRLLEIDSHADQPLAALCDAERRLVFIARALVHRPSLLVLDEPCQGLDAAHVDLVRRAVDRAVGRDVSSLIYVTHEPDELPGCISHTLTLTLAAGRVTPSGACA
jgi:molybdate transport system ATP-binding protein